MKRRTVALTAAWAAVTLVATLVAWRGVTVVADQVTESRPASLSSDEVTQAAGSARPERGGDATSTSSTTRAPSAGAPSPSATSPRPNGSAGVTSPPGATPAPPATAAPGPSPPATTAPPPPPQQPSGQTRTYELVGGTVVVQFNGNGTVTLLSSQPKPGFWRELHDDGPEKVDVEFESESHKSRLVARWENGQPNAEQDEDADDDGSGGGGS